MVTLLYSPFMPLCPIEYILSYTKKVSIFQKVGGKIFLERKAGGRKSLNIKCAQTPAVVAELVRASISWRFRHLKVESLNPGYPKNLYIYLRNAEIRAAELDRI